MQKKKKKRTAQRGCTSERLYEMKKFPALAFSDQRGGKILSFYFKISNLLIKSSD